MIEKVEIPISLLRAMLVWAYCPSAGSYPDAMVSMEDTCQDLSEAIAEFTGLDPYLTDDNMKYEDIDDLLHETIKLHSVVHELFSG